MEKYESPFTSRYASKEMSHLFSPHYRAILFRKLWIALAKAERTLGLSISEEQIAEMEKMADRIDFAAISAYEKRFRHDVMAHIHAFGDLCPLAKPILHLGATSCYVTDNADLILFKEALHLLLKKLVHVLRLIASFASTQAETPCLSYTHFQIAQPTTVGKRACLWLQDFLLDAQDWERIFLSLPFLGVKGATGTQSSFIALFDGDPIKVLKLEKLIAHEFGFEKILPVSGQTYTRKVDICILNAFASFAASAHKMGTDVRLLAHDGELFESSEKYQVGSSAMPYKRNPIYSERICGLSRFVISLAQNPLYTAATQWLERSLDDSSNRRLALSEAFLGVDSLLTLLAHLILRLRLDANGALDRLNASLPSLVMENILMKATAKGGDRQELHEELRKLSGDHSLESLLQEVAKKTAFGMDLDELNSELSLSSLIGRAPQQVRDFLENEVAPFLKKWQHVAISIPSVEI